MLNLDVQHQYVASYAYSQIHFNRLNSENLSNEFVSFRERAKKGDVNDQRLLEISLNKFVKTMSDSHENY
ncbi:hypothetical protein BTHERMOSOX_1221 [Bathymodiolus thermophilus thioautotrophic gill symbiont]|uniref:hypothetical protein n=1 Tax=Bathymodiolus thermophilus thioautotrophic gill symbiont TaxID=2360 RepID=UPI0010B9029E|nr:hypothetical protein [Bathymodiolus thermophilus thioautotrophic gill symbiont]SGZ77064.1 hypothetical protein BTHERMOSOX_1221 [Bathymodiolus thermophilus thioautotrophic gill symbiont]